MTTFSPQPLRMTWLAPDDFGGGVISVAEACCRQAALAGHAATLLLALPPKGHAAEFGGFQLRSLDARAPFSDVPSRLVQWLAGNPQDLLVLNGCEEADFAIPYLPQSTRLLYAVHDTAERYFAAAMRHESEIDAIVAVSRTVADRFRHRLHDQGKLHIVLNGTVLPDRTEQLHTTERAGDLMFLGGDKPIKGAFDVLALWDVLLRKNFNGRLHWFGEVSSAFRNAIERVAGSERIVVHGRQPRLAIFEAAARSKVLLMLSRVEPFGMATIECMGMGCLPVAWDIPTGTKEIMLDGEGHFARLGDFDALANAVLQVLDGHAARFRASSERIRVVFSEGAMWARYESMLGQVLQLAPAPRPLAGRQPPPFRRPVRFYQWLPPSLRTAIREVVGRWPRLGYALRDFRGR
jgi:hypothetical protein